LCSTVPRACALNTASSAVCSAVRHGIETATYCETLKLDVEGYDALEMLEESEPSAKRLLMLRNAITFAIRTPPMSVTVVFVTERL
jgi:hypothetical protein